MHLAGRGFGKTRTGAEHLAAALIVVCVAGDTVVSIERAVGRAPDVDVPPEFDLRPRHPQPVNPRRDRRAERQQMMQHARRPTR